MIRSLITCVALSVLVLTSVAAGVARGQADPVGQMVICSGHGPVMVHIDANGDPTGPPVLCPDGVLALLSAVAIAMPGAHPTQTVAHLTPTAPRALVAHRARTERRARSPPARV